MPTPLMAVAYPIIFFGVAFLMLGLAKLGKVKINNAALMCFLAGIMGVWFAFVLYKAGLPHLVGLIVKGEAAPLGDKLGPLLLKLATIVVLFSMLFILVGFTGLGLQGAELPSTGMFAIIVGIVELPYAFVILGAIKIIGVAVLLYAVAVIILGFAAKTGKGVAGAATIVVLVAIVEILIGLGFQFGMIAP